MGKHSEAFVGLDVAKSKKAVAIAEGGRNGEVRYLGAYEWRFNRPFALAANLELLARAAMRTAPRPYRSIALVKS